MLILQYRPRSTSRWPVDATATTHLLLSLPSERLSIHNCLITAVQSRVQVRSNFSTRFWTSFVLPETAASRQQSMAPTVTAKNTTSFKAHDQLFLHRSSFTAWGFAYSVLTGPTATVFWSNTCVVSTAIQAHVTVTSLRSHDSRWPRNTHQLQHTHWLATRASTFQSISFYCACVWAMLQTLLIFKCCVGAST